MESSVKNCFAVSKSEGRIIAALNADIDAACVDRDFFIERLPGDSNSLAVSCVINRVLNGGITTRRAHIPVCTEGACTHEIQECKEKFFFHANLCIGVGRKEDLLKDIEQLRAQGNEE